MKQFTSPPLQSGPRRTADPFAGTARNLFPVVDFAAGPRPPEATPVGDGDQTETPGATYQRIVDLPLAAYPPRDSLFIPPGNPIPAPDPATGLRHYASRTYLNLDDGTTLLAEHNPVTGEWHERLPDRLTAHGPALHWTASTNTWRRGSATSSHSSSPALDRALGSVSLVDASRLDPVWNLDLYTLPVTVAAGYNGSYPGRKAIMIGDNQYFMDAHYGRSSGDAPRADPSLYSQSARGVLRKVGRVEPNGLYRLDTGQFYLPKGAGFCKVEFDSQHLCWAIVDTSVRGGPDIPIEMGGAPDQWVPMLAIERVPELFQSARNIQGYTRLIGPVDRVNNSVDKRVYCYLQCYLRQVIGACDPVIRLAPVESKGLLIDDYIWRHGYPYDCLVPGFRALENGHALPPGFPVFDAFQGLGAVTCSDDGNFNVERVSGILQLRYPDRETSSAEDVLLKAWREKSEAKDNKGKGELNERLYEARLTEDGYVRLAGGTYGDGQNGFDLVFEGPAGHVYILEAKHVSNTSAGHLGSVSLAGATHARQMTHSWVRHVLARCDRFSPAWIRVRDALQAGQLFKLLGATTKEGKLIMFKIDMSPVDF